VLGHGYQAFWWTRDGVPVKQRQLVRPDQPFYFHNTFFEYTVALGYVGLILVIASMIATLGFVMRGVLAKADAATAFFHWPSMPGRGPMWRSISTARLNRCRRCSGSPARRCRPTRPRSRVGAPQRVWSRMASRAPPERALVRWCGCA
jgi:hypothetical protein